MDKPTGSAKGKEYCNLNCMILVRQKSANHIFKPYIKYEVIIYPHCNLTCNL